MADAPLFYRSVVPLNREQHRHLKLRTPERPFDFASGTYVIPALVEEFAAACRHLPIMFLPGATQPTPVFLVGLRPNKNNLVDGAGHWVGGYVPAFVRRYPFIIGEVEGGNPILCVDETSARLSGDAGEPLFAEDGTDTAVLAERMKFANDFFAAAKQTDRLALKLRDLELLRPITVESKPAGQDSAVVHGLLMVDEAKLSGLPDDAFLELRRSGWLGPLYAHLLSLAAVDRLAAPAEAI